MDEVIKQMILTHAGKINLFMVMKAIIETILFVVFIKLGNKTFNVFFDKIIAKLHDTEIKKQYQTLRQLGIYILDAILILFFTTNILGDFGIDMKPILATAGVVGVAVGFGGKKFVEDLLTGLSIILSGQLRVGDYVTVNSSTGTVEKVTLTMIVLRAYNGDVHYLRNGQIDTIINQTKNYSTPIFDIAVAYSTNINHVIRVLNELGKEIREMPEYGKYVLADIMISGLNEFQDSAIIVQCRLKTTPQEQWIIKRKFNQMIKERFEKEGIEIPFPQVVVNKPSENEEKVS
jgi:moderate conductance mechanosensitive channel